MAQNIITDATETVLVQNINYAALYAIQNWIENAFWIK